MDIVHNKAFKQAYGALAGQLKQNMALGLSKPTQHKAVVSPDDLHKISQYLSSISCPVILRYCVWFNLSLHFVSRGLEFHQQLTPKSFLFLKDDKGVEYVSLSHETKQEIWQWRLENQEAPHDKRMHATGDSNCPVQTLKTFLQPIDLQATFLFNHCSKAALSSPQTTDIWYLAKPCKQYQFSKFMPDISRNARKYTAQQYKLFIDEGFDIRHIMYMSGHRNEASVRSYNRDCSTAQNQHISHALAKVAKASSSAESSSCMVASPCTFRISTALPQQVHV